MVFASIIEAWRQKSLIAHGEYKNSWPSTFTHVLKKLNFHATQCHICIHYVRKSQIKIIIIIIKNVNTQFFKS